MAGGAELCGHSARPPKPTTVATIHFAPTSPVLLDSIAVAR